MDNPCDTVFSVIHLVGWSCLATLIITFAILKVCEWYENRKAGREVIQRYNRFVAKWDGIQEKADREMIQRIVKEVLVGVKLRPTAKPGNEAGKP